MGGFSKYLGAYLVYRDLDSYYITYSFYGVVLPRFLKVFLTVIVTVLILNIFGFGHICQFLSIFQLGYFKLLTFSPIAHTIVSV